VTDFGRYVSQMIIPEIGVDGQVKLAQAQVLVIGAGGLGCPVLLYLVGLGIGTLGIMDADVVEMGNLHRQVLYTEADIGRPKALIAQQKLQQNNSTLAIHAYAEKLDAKNATAYIRQYDMVVDCCDNAVTRYYIDDATRQLGKPFVYGAVSQWDGQLSVFNYQGGPSYAQLFPKDSTAPAVDCAASGIVGFTAGLLACLQVNEVRKIILNSPEICSGQLLTVNLQTIQMRRFTIKTG
jgi:molybdopterin/thiamine biosynthesis adenylyltransferase